MEKRFILAGGSSFSNFGQFDLQSTGFTANLILFNEVFTCRKEADTRTRITLKKCVLKFQENKNGCKENCKKGAG